MHLLDGKATAEKVFADCRLDVEALGSKGIKPGLAVVMVGEDPASRVYVASKARRCHDLGMMSLKMELPAWTTQSELLRVVEQLNANEVIDGILVQSPLPPPLDESVIFHAIDPRKDIDGFHPVNVAKLALEDPSGFVPCTPLGVQHLLIESGIDIEGAHVVVLGRSMIVGKPLALLLMAKGAGGNATVTIAHSKTRDLPGMSRRADILVSAIGKAGLVRADFVKEGAVVVDVGINRIAAPGTKSGFKLAGDVAFDEVAPKCRAITPVPGGVGPMTIGMLMKNTLKACRQRRGIA
ncbi:MAG: bifunctional 5,10-methylenetetrahydrofolate dehydrogenase/5,10-methenyltetrahydrofolate cyclohydrolase [Verrucomicrobiales bacterium]